MGTRERAPRPAPAPWSGASLALLLALLACAATSTTAQLEVDRDALLQLKAAFADFAEAPQLEQWTAESLPCNPTTKDWPYVVCAAQRVIEIRLANRRLLGELPTALRRMSELKVLDLANNRFYGTLPTLWGAKGYLPKLTHLLLANNDLSGTIPGWNRVGAFAALQEIDLSGNNFWGGLPAGWLGTGRLLEFATRVDLSRNQLGYDEAGATLTRNQWCNDGDLTLGSGWCPRGLPLPGTAPLLAELDLSDNGFSGPLPNAWPKIFTGLETLYLHRNSLWPEDEAGNPVPTALPSLWTKKQLRGFKRLENLILYPGNDYYCSMMDVDGSYKDVNLDATYYIMDDLFNDYGGDNAVFCPAYLDEDNPPTAVTFASKRAISWTYTLPQAGVGYIWGFRLSIVGLDSEGEAYVAPQGWASTRLRIFTKGGDGFTAADVAAQGLACTTNPDGASGDCTLTFADATAPRLLQPNWGAFPPSGDIASWQVDVRVVGMDGIESSRKSATLANV